MTRSEKREFVKVPRNAVPEHIMAMVERVASFWDNQAYALELILRCLVKVKNKEIYQIHGVDQEFSVTKFLHLHQRAHERRCKHNVPHEIRHLQVELSQRAKPRSTALPTACPSLSAVEGMEPCLSGYRKPR